MNKLMFYNTLRKVKQIKPLQIPKVIEDDGLKQELQRYFDIAKEATKDYETIFGFDFLEKIPLPNDIISSLISYINGLSKYDFTKLGYKDLGHTFDRLIPDGERHNLGQYHTNPNVVDIINTFCIRDADEKVADFGCGAGTFLVRAYARIKYLNPPKTHGEILNQIIGGDILKFAAHLSMINLASRDLSKVENYPLVLCKDFFDILPSKSVRWPKTSRESVETLSGKKVKVELPPELDVVVGNPPYTRQEELEVYVQDYKEKLQDVLTHDWGEKVKLGLRVGLHGYFFFHGLRFLKNGGRFGYITSNSWLDVDYGKYFQKFFLNKCKIVAIIEPKERVFPDADINTVITILERCDNKKEREKNLVKFVRLKVSLKELIPENNDEKKFGIIEKLVKQVENTHKLYEDDKLRIYPVSQSELWKQGYDKEENQYVGSKWGKYLRAPDIFFKILNKKNKFTSIKTIAKIRRGFSSGANKFFYQKIEQIKKLNLEKEFWTTEGKANYVFSSPRESNNIDLRKANLKYIIPIIKVDKKDLVGTNALKFIKLGEKQGVNKNPTCAVRKRWYQLPARKECQIIFPRTMNDRYIAYINSNVYPNDRFYEIYCKKQSIPIILGYLNSTLFPLIAEVTAKVSLGLGALDLNIFEFVNIPFINPKIISKKQIKELEKIINKLKERAIGSVFEEVGADSPEEVSLDKVKPDRRELDKILMGEILGLTEEEQLEVYKAVIKLVKHRIERAKSVKKRKKVSGADPEALAEGILREIDTSKLKKFPDDYIRNYECEIREVPEGQPELGSDLKGFFVKIDDERINCNSSEEAHWIYYAVLNGVTSVKIPKNKKATKETLGKYAKILKKIRKKIETKLEEYIPDRKLKEKVKTIIDDRLFRQERKKTTS